MLFLRQNIVQKPSMASIKEVLFMSIDKCIKALLYFLNLRIIYRAIFAMLRQTTNSVHQSGGRQKICIKLEKKLWS